MIAPISMTMAVKIIIVRAMLFCVFFVFLDVTESEIGIFAMDGSEVGSIVGLNVVGPGVGSLVLGVGFCVGSDVGSIDGLNVVGPGVGSFVGEKVGDFDGFLDGDNVG